MALVLADRVRETTTTTGTGTISLAGPVSGFQGFSTAIGNANTTYYTIVDAATGAWEVGLGTYTASGSTLARTTVLSSSNSGALVPFGVGTKDVFVTQPAERAVYVLGAGTGLAAGAAAFTANGVPYADSTSTLATSSNLTFNGTTLTANALTTTSTVTINGGTANGVAYLNGSKVLTTGSALTFDGTKLVASGGNEAIRIASGAPYYSFYNAAQTTQFGYIQHTGTDLALVNVQNGAMPFYVNNTEQMRLTSTGLGIGTSSPTSKLVVSNGGGAGLEVNPTGVASAPVILSYNRSGAAYTQLTYLALQHVWQNSGTEVARINTSGALLVGQTSWAFANNGTQIAANGRIFNTSNTDYNMELAGSTNARIRFYSSAGGSGTTVGNITVDTTNTQYNTSSDYRLKNITGPITTSGAYIDSLNPVEGTWKIDGSTFVGLIAHEAQEVSRTKVATGVKDGPDMQGMAYSSAEIIANLIAELQSLRKRVAQLEGA